MNYIVQRSNHQDLMLAYNIPFFEKGDLEAFLTGLARAQQRIRKVSTDNVWIRVRLTGHSMANPI